MSEAEKRTLAKVIAGAMDCCGCGCCCEQEYAQLHIAAKSLLSMLPDLAPDIHAAVLRWNAAQEAYEGKRSSDPEWTEYEAARNHLQELLEA